MSDDALPAEVHRDNTHVFIAAAKQGSEPALARLLESYRAFLRQIARRGLGRDLRGKIAPSDLVQETLIEAHRDFHQFRSSSESRLQVWLAGLLKNNLADARRRFRDAAKRDVSREVAFDSSIKALTADAPRSQSADAIDPEELQRAIEQLSEEARQILRLRHEERLTFAEIGCQMEKTADAARMFYSRVVSQLRRQLNLDSTEGQASNDTL